MRAGAFTVAFGINDNGQTAGGYADRKGRLHGFLRDGDEFTVIDFPGAKAMFAARINAAGQIVGAYSPKTNVAALELSHGFLLDNGVFKRIDVPGAARTQPFGINNRGQIVGEYVDAEGVTHGFLLSQGVYTTIDVPGAMATFALDIDDRGRIVGFSFDGAVFHSFLRDAQGTFTPVDDPRAARGTLPVGINNRGQIVGVALILDEDQGLVSRGFALENSVFTTIEHPDAIFQLWSSISATPVSSPASTTAPATATSGTGRATLSLSIPLRAASTRSSASTTAARSWGRYFDANLRARGFLRDKQDFTSIEVPGALQTLAYKIDDRGQIVGGYRLHL